MYFGGIFVDWSGIIVVRIVVRVSGGGIIQSIVGLNIYIFFMVGKVFVFYLKSGYKIYVYV